MEDCFNFESKFRYTRNLMMLDFTTSDGTHWTLTEEWFKRQKKPKFMLQRFIFTKEDNYDRHYIISIEISPVSNKASGKLKVVVRSIRPLAKLIVPIEDYKVFRFSVSKTEILHNIEISDRVLQDNFRYKVTINRAYPMEVENSEAGPIRTGDRLLVFSNQMLSLLETGNFSDIVLTDGHSQIRAHRNILCARSEFFMNMFASNMVESKEGVIYIPDIGIGILKEMLRYMYSGVLRPLEMPTVMELFTAAAKYELNELKKLCTDIISRHMAFEHVVCVYELADRHMDTALKDVIKFFVALRFDETNEEVAVSALKLDHPDFYEEIVDHHAFLNRPIDILPVLVPPLDDQPVGDQPAVDEQVGVQAGAPHN